METDLMTEEDERSRCAQRAYDLTWKQFELTEELRFCQLDMQEIYTPRLHAAERQLAMARHQVEAHRDRLLTAAHGVMSVRREAVMSIAMARLAFQETVPSTSTSLHSSPNPSSSNMSVEGLGPRIGEMRVLPGSVETAQIYTRMVGLAQTPPPLPPNNSNHSASGDSRETPMVATLSFHSENISNHNISDNSTTNNPPTDSEDANATPAESTDDFIPSVVSTFEARQKRKAARNAPRDYLAEATAVLAVWRSQLEQPLICEEEKDMAQEKGTSLRETVHDGVTVMVQREIIGDPGANGSGSKGVPSRPVNWGDRSNPPRSVGIPRTTANQWESRGSDSRKYAGDFRGEYRGWFPMGPTPTVNQTDSMSFNAHRGMRGNYSSGGASSTSSKRRVGRGAGHESLPPAGGGSPDISHHHHRTTVRINGKLFLRSVPIWSNTWPHTSEHQGVEEGTENHHNIADDGKGRRGVGRVTFTLYDPQSTGLWRVVATDTLLSPLDFSLDVPIVLAHGSKPGSKAGSKQGSRQPSRTPTMVVSPVLSSTTTTNTTTTAAAMVSSTSLPLFLTKSVSFLSHTAGTGDGSGGASGGGASITLAFAKAAASGNDSVPNGGEGGVGGVGVGVDWLTQLTTTSQQLIDSAVERTRDRVLGDTPFIFIHTITLIPSNMDTLAYIPNHMFHTLPLTPPTPPHAFPSPSGPSQDELARCYRRIIWLSSRLSTLFRGLLNPLEADMATVLNDDHEEERIREEKLHGPPKKIYDFMGLKTLEQAEAEEEGDSLNHGVEDSPEDNDLILSRQALHQFMLPNGTVDDVMRSVALRPGPTHYHLALVPWSELEPCVVIQTDPFHWMYLVRKYLRCEFADAQKTRTLTPAGKRPRPALCHSLDPSPCASVCHFPSSCFSRFSYPHLPSIVPSPFSPPSPFLLLSPPPFSPLPFPPLSFQPCCTAILMTKRGVATWTPPLGLVLVL